MKRQRARTGLERWLTLDETASELPISAEDRVRISSETTQSVDALTQSDSGVSCANGVLRWALLPYPLGSPFAHAAHRQLVRAIAVAVLMPTFLIGMRAIKRLGYSRVLFYVLRTRGFNICLNCGYWMKNLNADSGCPECGWNRDEQPRRRNDAAEGFAAAASGDDESGDSDEMTGRA